MYRPVPRASAGRGLFVPSLEGWIRNSTSRPPRLDAAAVPVTCRSQGIMSPPTRDLQNLLAKPG